MKIKTTLAALLLTAVMVTPSYGAEIDFLDGAKAELKEARGEELSWDEDVCNYYFMGIVDALYGEYVVDCPKEVTTGQGYLVVAKYIYEHPAETHEHENELVRRAWKEALPKENAHVQTTKRVKRKLFGGGNADAVARDGNR